MFNFGKKAKDEQLARLIDLFQRSAMLSFFENNYKTTIDTCNLILELNPRDSIAIEFKIRSLLLLENFKENWKDFGEEIDKLEDKLREIEPNNPWIIGYDKFLKEWVGDDVKQNIVDVKYNEYSDLRNQICKMPIYERWRQEVIKKCENKCQMCGSTNNLEVHHLDSFYSILKHNNIDSVEKAFQCKQLWSIDNGEVLCKNCHDKMDSSKKHNELSAS